MISRKNTIANKYLARRNLFSCGNKFQMSQYKISVLFTLSNELKILLSSTILLAQFLPPEVLIVKNAHTDIPKMQDKLLLMELLTFH